MRVQLGDVCTAQEESSGELKPSLHALRALHPGGYICPEGSLFLIFTQIPTPAKWHPLDY